jgi:hypothetical protein
MVCEQKPSDAFAVAVRHAANDDRVLPDGNHHHPGHHASPDGTHYNFRRIYTDGRDWPEEIEPSFAGYSNGKLIDEDGDGRYDVLSVETRGLKGPRAFDSTGLPLHRYNRTIVKERIYQDQANPNNSIQDST